MPSLAATTSHHHDEKTQHEPARSLTWPPRIRTSGLEQHKIAAAPASLSTPALLSESSHQPAQSSFEDELNQNPEDHYLSPVQMYEYEDWADDSDDDDEGEEVEWDAGILDFALFDSERRAAQERQESVPGRWQHLINSQTSALQRAAERERASDDAESSSSSPSLPQPVAIVVHPPPGVEDVPPLTPDGSPHMRDDFDVEDFHQQRQQQQRQQTRLVVPNYLLPSVPSFKDSATKEDFNNYANDSPSDSDSDDAEIPVSVLVERARMRRLHSAPVIQQLRAQRPGLRSNRTLSGKLHVWRRPDSDIYPVRENAEAEAAAEAEAETTVR